METIIDVSHFKGFNLFTQWNKDGCKEYEWDVIAYLEEGTQPYFSLEGDSLVKILFELKDFIDSTEGMIYDL